MDDGIDGENYNLKVLGDGTGEVMLNNLVNGVNRFNLTSGSVTHLGKMPLSMCRIILPTMQRCGWICPLTGKAKMFKRTD